MPRMFLARMDGRKYCCLGPPNSCYNLTLLQAEPHTFHRDELIEATDRINEILADLREQAPEGQHLALIDTTFGLLLVWAEAIERPDDLSEFVTVDSPPEEIRRVLGIVDPPAAA